MASFGSSAGVNVLLSTSTDGDFIGLASTSTGETTAFGDVNSDSRSLFLLLKRLFKPAVMLQRTIKINDMIYTKNTPNGQTFPSLN